MWQHLQQAPVSYPTWRGQNARHLCLKLNWNTHNSRSLEPLSPASDTFQVRGFISLTLRLATKRHHPVAPNPETDSKKLQTSSSVSGLFADSELTDITYGVGSIEPLLLQMMVTRSAFPRHLLLRKATSTPVPVQVVGFMPTYLSSSRCVLFCCALDTFLIELSLFAAGIAFHPLGKSAGWLASQFNRTFLCVQSNHHRIQSLNTRFMLVLV